VASEFGVVELDDLVDEELVDHVSLAH